MTYGKSDGRFLLYGVKSQDGCFYFASYHFLSWHNTVLTSAKKMTIFMHNMQTQEFHPYVLLLPWLDMIVLKQWQ